MPTDDQNAVAILNALVNRTSSQSLRQRVAAAYSGSDGFLQSLRDTVKAQVRRYEQTQNPDTDFEVTP